MWNKKAVCGYVFLLLGLLGVFTFLSKPVHATGGINPIISFEGKIVDKTSGVNIADATYNMEFKIYSGPSNIGTGDTLLWTENWLVGSTQGGIALTSGTYQVNLGSAGAGDSVALSSLNWNQYPLWLSVQIGNSSSCTITTTFTSNCGGDGEMTPYIQLASTPYSFTSTQVGYTEGGFVGTLSFVSTLTGTDNITIPDASGTICLQNATACGFAASSGSGNYIQNQNASPQTSSNFNISGTGQAAAFDAASASIASVAVPTTNLVNISNSGHAVTTTNVNGLGINYTGGSAAVTGSGIRIDYTPGGTSGGIWSGLNIVANTSGAATGVLSYGIDLTGPTTLNGGTNTAVEVATGWNIGVDIQSGGIQLAAQSDPASPAASNLRIYAKNVAGLIMPEWLSPTDQNTPFQPGLGFNRVAYSEPNGVANCTTGATGFGDTSVGGTTCTAPTPTSTSLYTSVRLENFTTGATAGTVNYQKQDVLQVWRGNAADLGGYFFTIRFGLNTLQTGNRAFVGLADSIATPTNVDPTTSTTPGKLGMAINASTGDWNFVNNVTGTAPTSTSLGASFPVNTTDLFELIMYCPEDGSTITYRVTDETTGAQTTGTVTTNMPAATTFLAPLFWNTNNATAAASIFSFNGWYLQSDN